MTVNVTLHIDGPFGSKTVTLADELSIGRTELAQLVLDDSGLSRVNTTFFVDGDEVFVADENSLNGTFLNGEKVEGRPRRLADGDQIRIGSDTRIRVEIGGGFGSAVEKPEVQPDRTELPLPPSPALTKAILVNSRTYQSRSSAAAPATCGAACEVPDTSE